MTTKKSLLGLPMAKAGTGNRPTKEIKAKIVQALDEIHAYGYRVLSGLKPVVAANSAVFEALLAWRSVETSKATEAAEKIIEVLDTCVPNSCAERTKVQKLVQEHYDGV